MARSEIEALKGPGEFTDYGFEDDGIMTTHGETGEVRS